MIVEGQGHGGIAQGIGQAMLEDFVYEESGAQILSGASWTTACPGRTKEQEPTFSEKWRGKFKDVDVDSARCEFLARKYL